MPVQKLQLKLNIRKFLKVITRKQKKKTVVKLNLAKTIKTITVVMANAKTALADVVTPHSAF
ncbi:hypothetical protein [Chryseobacterium echinoideorum]|uniref:hypothetical protein n=1 Tax=Chryseobacterium echinoideorum TaxID=1549648 RepID=UPI0011867602|nr:hypothetical protein [Chryseobacterium echinoideorum]